MAELDPFEPSAAVRPPLPDEAERAAAALIALTLADRDDDAAAVLGELRENEEAREIPTGLVDDAEALVFAAAGSTAFDAYARRAIDADGTGPALALRLQRHLEARPLALARRRLREDRTQKIAALANRAIGPASRLTLGASLNPIETGRAALASLLMLHSVPTATTRERQALRAYQDYAEREPEGADLPEALEQIARYDLKRRRQLHEDLLEAAARSLEAHRPDVALEHLERAERILERQDGAAALRARASVEAARSAADVERALGTDSAAVDHSRALVVALLVGAPPSVEALANADGPAAEADERAFARAVSVRTEAALFDALEPVAADVESNMARHAARVLHDPEQNPYAQYRAAVSQDRSRQVRWLFFGRHARGPAERDLPRPLEWVLDSPGIVSSVISLPLRMLQYPFMRRQFGGPILASGERYLERYPDGRHAESVRSNLERRYAARGQYARALAHHDARGETDPDRRASYREKLAKRTLALAKQYPRLDARASVYRSLAGEYPETEAGKQARAELDALIQNATPQEIRISKAFLMEHPSLWGAGALGLRPELMDEEDGNGEIAPEGVTLLGKTIVRVEFEDAEAVTEMVDRENFARFIAALEEAAHLDLATDPREKPDPDPQRDLFFERARLGMLDAADMRPAATSRFVFQGKAEKFGAVKRRDSVLPVDVVLQGGLEDFGFAATPRLREPAESPDAFLYR